ncbi:hypothetical protein AVEN_186382-1 [Araneus ventricosus]|uniref:LIM zinc-binding domain-containing protein n=1 Tax=Araneus ventricosus TaxID=182803 RepID=A0A4Y2T402_ARAVE|nr:hypothetical protein AVEN_143016-1 [Araneus ventricosus]GBN93489.1 hypothetical protein AVEN_183501-1 [Araneus ventricosus]GBN94158.1 hypothetical protein AVEN_9459-1 [Araneus ventricosus]GBN94159.1 hypothetical protein AVEN_186382-1 [Araneus ventricosus]
MAEVQEEVKKTKKKTKKTVTRVEVETEESKTNFGDQNQDKNELIFSNEYTKAMSKEWHQSHFCCWKCDESLTGHRYVLKDEHPYCVQCYEQIFANNCEECGKPIGIDSKVKSLNNKN